MKANSLKLVCITILTSASAVMSFAPPSNAFFWGNNGTKIGKAGTGDIMKYCKIRAHKCSSLTAATTQVNADKLCKWKYKNEYKVNDIYGKRAGGGIGPIQFNNSVECFAKNQPTDE